MLRRKGTDNPGVLIGSTEACDAQHTRNDDANSQPCSDFERSLFVDKTRDLVVGDPNDSTTQVGPLARADLRIQVDDQVVRSLVQGARLLTGGQSIDKPGYFYEPTVLSEVRPGMAVFDEETFGPVAAISRNFEPSELGAAFGLVQLSKLDKNYARRAQIFDAFNGAFGSYPGLFRLPKQLPDFHTAWLCYPVTIREDAGFTRPDLQGYLESVGIDTRTVWSGNVTRHPMMRKVEYRIPAGGLPKADEVFERGMSLGMSHGMSDEELNHVVNSIHEFAAKFAPATQ